MLIDDHLNPPLTRADDHLERSPVRWAATISGMFFLAIGFAGFFPGLTQNFNSIEMGYGSEAMVLGSSRSPCCTTSSTCSWAGPASRW